MTGLAGGWDGSGIEVAAIKGFVGPIAQQSRLLASIDRLESLFMATIAQSREVAVQEDGWAEAFVTPLAGQFRVDPLPAVADLIEPPVVPLQNDQCSRQVAMRDVAILVCHLVKVGWAIAKEWKEYTIEADIVFVEVAHLHLACV